MEIQSKKRRKVSWTDLPTNVIQSIIIFLSSNIVDVQNFRTVCKNWRRTTLISASLPRRIKFKTTTSAAVHSKLFSSSIYLLRQPGAAPECLPWMVLEAQTTNGVTQLFNPFSRTLLPDTPKNLDLTQFQFTQLATEFHIVSDKKRNHLFSNACGYGKVLLFMHRSTSTIDHCNMLALSNEGKVSKLFPFYTYHSFHPPFKDDKCKIDDLIRYKGKNYALNKKGELYKYGGSGFDCDKPLVSYPNSVLALRRKRLAVMVSVSGAKLYMVVPVDYVVTKLTVIVVLRKFKVYVLKDERTRNSWVWEEVKSFEGDDKVLYVTRDYCFFVVAAEFSGCKLRNRIVYSDDAFPKYSMNTSGWEFGKQGGNKLEVFSLAKNYRNNLPVERYPGFPVKLWSMPAWVMRNSSLTLQSQSERESEQDEMVIHSDSGGKQTTEVPSTCAAQAETITHLPVCRVMEHVAEEVLETSNVKEFNQGSFVPELIEKVVEMASSSEARGRITRALTMNEIEDQVREEPLPETLRAEKEIDPACTAHTASITQSNRNDNLTVKFEGFDIRSNLLPTLQNIWSTHGNIVENSTIHNGDIIARVLESLATAIFILKHNSALSLSDDQADYLSSTLSDLTCLHFKVEWLVPFVEKALRLHKHKPLLDSLNKLRQCKAQTAMQRSKLLGELAELDTLDKEMEESMANMSNMLHLSGDMDLHQLLGGDLP